MKNTIIFALLLIGTSCNKTKQDAINNSGTPSKNTTYSPIGIWAGVDTIIITSTSFTKPPVTINSTISGDGIIQTLSDNTTYTAYRYQISAGNDSLFLYPAISPKIWCYKRIM